jgi:hypothetical protein
MDQAPDPQLIALYEGQCISNSDPEGRGRIKVLVPGIFDNDSHWVPPMGATGGGQKNMGFFFPPRVGANVNIFFKGGDADHPRYLAGSWGVTDGKSDIPGFAQIDPHDEVTPIPADERALVNGIETEYWQIILDNRPGEGKQRLLIRSKTYQALELDDGTVLNVRNEIDMDGELISINAVSGLSITCKGSISIDSMNLRLNGRVVDSTTDRVI